MKLKFESKFIIVVVVSSSKVIMKVIMKKKKDLKQLFHHTRSHCHVEKFNQKILIFDHYPM